MERKFKDESLNRKVEVVVGPTSLELEDSWSLDKYKSVSGTDISIKTSGEDDPIVLINSIHLGFLDGKQYKLEIFNKCITINSEEGIMTKIKYLEDIDLDIIEKIRMINLHYDSQLKNIKKRIKFEKKKIKIFNAEVKDELKILKEELMELVDKFEEKSEALNRSVIELGEKQDNILVDRIESWKEILIKDTNAKAEVFKLREEKLGLSHRDNTGNKKREEYNQKMSNRINDRLDQIEKATISLNIDGINPVIYNILIGIGTLGAIAAGWFFSIFALAKNLNIDSIPFFLLKGFFDFGDSLNLSVSWTRPLLALFVWISILGIITLLLSWADQSEDRKLTSNYRLGVDSSKSKSGQANISTNSTLIVWKFLLPILFLSGILSIVLFIGRDGVTNNEELNRLDISMSAQLIGTFISFTVYGLMYIYITKIVEPRVRKNEGTDQSLFRSNIEIVVILTVFFLVVLLNLVISSGENNKEVLSMCYFMIVTFISAISFSYGYRARGLLRTEHFYRRLLQKNEFHIARLNDKFDLRSRDAEMKAFQNNYKNINKSVHDKILDSIQNMYTLLSNREKKADNKSVNNSNDKKYESKSRLLIFLTSLNPFSDVDKKINEDNNINTDEGTNKNKFDNDINVISDDLDELERYVFNKKIKQIKVLTLECNNLKNAIKGKRGEISRKEKRDEVNERFNIISDLEKYKILLDKHRLELLNYIRNMRHTINTNVEDVYDLSLWYHKNKSKSE